MVHAHKVLPDAQDFHNRRGRDGDESKYIRCHTTHLVNIKTPEDATSDRSQSNNQEGGFPRLNRSYVD